MLLLDLGLGGGDGAGDHLVLDGDVVGDVRHGHHAVHDLGAEQAHQVVLQGEVEAGGPVVALAPRAAAQLVVDTAGLVALGAQHIEPAELLDLLVRRPDRGGDALTHLAAGVGVLLLGECALLQLGGYEGLGIAAEHDVGAAARHVGGHGDGALAARLGHDLGLALVVLGVEHLVPDTAFPEQRGEQFGLLHRRGADEDRLPLGVPLGDVLHDRGVLGVRGAVDLVGVVGAPRGRLVGIGTTWSW